MARYSNFWLLMAALSIMFISCQRSENQKYAEQQVGATSAMADSVASGYIGSSASQVIRTDSGKKFVRTADLRFRVQDVARSTYAIEDAVRQQGGYVSFTDLSSSKDRIEENRVSEDSVLETTYYTVSNILTIRVPNERLDSTLKLIAGQVDFLDSRQIKSDDVSLDYLANKLSLQRQQKTAGRLSRAIDMRQAKLGDISDAEANREEREGGADESIISNLRIDDQVSLSTVMIDIYQRQAVHRTMVIRYAERPAYKPGFISRLVNAFSFGWNMIQEVLLFIIKFWALFLAGWVVYFIVRVLRGGKQAKG